MSRSSTILDAPAQRRCLSSPLAAMLVLLVLPTSLLRGQADDKPTIFRAQGEMTGEVDETSALLQTRLTAVAENVTGDIAGRDGWARFEYAENPDFSNARHTEWQRAERAHDHIVRATLQGLQPGTRYYYRVHYGTSRDEFRVGETCSFRTLQGTEGTQPVSFVVVTGMNYERFHGADRARKAPRPERADGYPALATMADLNLDFFVGTGDNVYFDSKAFDARTLPEMRQKYRQQFCQSRFVDLFRNVATYWEKDDHDHRYNDCDRTGNRAPSSALGIATFREQLPVVPQGDDASPTYRTYRVNRDLQIWLVEGRDYRSPNRTPDGPEKTLWGKEQLDWLKRTLLESDASFKLLISPTPLVGPDDAYKIDNHTNHKGFRHEGREFFRWVIEKDLHRNGFYTICGDRHWQYHSRDPLGVEEFSCGALVDENSRLGRKPGDPKSTDPNAEIQQFYTQQQPSGGFLRVTVGPSDEGRPEARFTFFDDEGAVLYETVKSRQ